MKLTLIRTNRTDEYTEGVMLLDGKHFCDTLEPRDAGFTESTSEEEIIRTKAKGLVAVPPGEYHIDREHVSKRFKFREWARPFDGRTPMLLSVKGFAGVLIHPGNTVADTSGCVLTGKRDAPGHLVQSVWHYQQLARSIFSSRDEVTLRIKSTNK